MNLQEQTRVRNQIMRLQDAVGSLIAENAKLREQLESLKATVLAIQQKRGPGRPRKDDDG